MALFRAMLSASLVESQLEYSDNCSVRVIFSVVRFLIEARSSAVACARFSNAMYISMTLLAGHVLYLSLRGVCCCLCSLACASMKCAWN